MTVRNVKSGTGANMGSLGTCSKYHFIFDRWVLGRNKLFKNNAWAL